MYQSFYYAKKSGCFSTLSDHYKATIMSKEINISLQIDRMFICFCIMSVHMVNFQYQH